MVKLYEKYEHYVGKLSHDSFCVTEAMAAELKNSWGVKATPLYDRAADIFHVFNSSEQLKLWEKLQKQHSHCKMIKSIVESFHSIR